jgi:hypothetical protein
VGCPLGGAAVTAPSSPPVRRVASSAWGTVISLRPAPRVTVVVVMRNLHVQRSGPHPSVVACRSQGSGGGSGGVRSCQPRRKRLPAPPPAPFSLRSAAPREVSDPTPSTFWSLLQLISVPRPPHCCHIPASLCPQALFFPSRIAVGFVISLLATSTLCVLTVRAMDSVQDSIDESDSQSSRSVFTGLASMQSLFVEETAQEVGPSATGCKGDMRGKEGIWGVEQPRC